MRFQKEKLKYRRSYRQDDYTVRCYDYGNFISVCVSRNRDPETQQNYLTVSAGLPKGKRPDQAWITGVVRHFGMRTDRPIEMFTHEGQNHTSYYYMQYQEETVRDCGGIRRLPLLS